LNHKTLIFLLKVFSELRLTSEFLLVSFSATKSGKPTSAELCLSSN